MGTVYAVVLTAALAYAVATGQLDPSMAWQKLVEFMQKVASSVPACVEG